MILAEMQKSFIVSDTLPWIEDKDGNMDEEDNMDARSDKAHNMDEELNSIQSKKKRSPLKKRKMDLEKDNTAI